MHLTDPNRPKTLGGNPALVTEGGRTVGVIPNIQVEFLDGTTCRLVAYLMSGHVTARLYWGKELPINMLGEVLENYPIDPEAFLREQFGYTPIHLSAPPPAPVKKKLSLADLGFGP
jgi:hypothetical protein